MLNCENQFVGKKHCTRIDRIKHDKHDNMINMINIIFNFDTRCYFFTLR